MTCRICLEPGGQTFCKCNGTVGLVHHDCLMKWLKVSHRDSCEICKHEFQTKTRIHPSCTLTAGDILLSEKPCTNVVILCISMLSASIFICMFFIIKSYLSITIAWSIGNLLLTICTYNQTYPVNVFIYLTCIMTLTAGFFATGNRTNYELVTSSIICMYTLLGACVVWLIRYIVQKCFNNSLTEIMVYKQDNSNTNHVDPRVHTDKPESPRCTQITI